MKQLFLFLLTTIFTCQVYSQPRSLEQAKNAAESFLMRDFNQKVGHLICSTSRNRSIKVSATNADYVPFYVFSDSSSMSFVIISGDERMKEVLGYSDNNVWCESDIPEGLQDLLDTYQRQYEFLQSDSCVVTGKPLSVYIPDVKPLIETQWNQSSPYNDLCPNGLASGCVATAMAQVMKYHNYPTQGTGSFSYRTRSRGINCSFDFGATIFDWNKMKNSYDSYSFYDDSDSRAAVAKIMFSCGVSVGMDYGTNFTTASGAYTFDIPYALIHFFNYNENVAYYNRDYFSSEEWYQILCNELKNGRPVLYAGADSRDGGHEFVIDGCSSSTRKFHVNWGWGGNHDGYYELDALDPGQYHFSIGQEMVVNISPTPVGIHEDIFYANRFSSQGTIGIGKTVKFTISDVYCYSNQSSSLYAVEKAKFYGKIGVGLYDKDFNLISILNSDSIEGLNSAYGYSTIYYTGKISKSMFPSNGKYYFAPFVQYKDSKTPTRIRTKEGKTDYIAITIDEDDIDEGEDDDTIEVVTTWREDFELFNIPSEWQQKVELGDGMWKVQSVFIPSESFPLAASGRCYAYLEYKSAPMSLSSERAVTRLVTNFVRLANGNTYNISFQYRKYTTNINPIDVLSIYYEQDGVWKHLSNVSIINQSEWNKAEISLPVSGSIRLAFEGSLSMYSTIFLDDLKIYESQNKIITIDDIITLIDKSLEVNSSVTIADITNLIDKYLSQE